MATHGFCAAPSRLFVAIAVDNTRNTQGSSCSAPRSLLESSGNQNRAAAALKMSRQALAYQIRELGILKLGCS